MKTTCKICGIVDKPHKCPHAKRKTDRSRRDKQVYSKGAWQQVREEVLDQFNFICLWSFYIDGEIKAANTVHHIVELLEDESLAHELSNLIPLSRDAHELIHKLYRTGKREATQDLLNKLRIAYLRGDRNMGAYELTE